jgi:hypothetical protein
MHPLRWGSNYFFAPLLANFAVFFLQGLDAKGRLADIYGAGWGEILQG